MVAFGKILLGLGVALLLHSAYSASHHREYLRMTEKAYHGLPRDVVTECIAAVAVCSLGIVLVYTGFRPIREASVVRDRTWDNVNSRPGFWTFNHRATLAALRQQTPSSKSD
eukprot:m51a1_g9194 hypothetical protein (112) ;mRNA; f:95437-95929